MGSGDLIKRLDEKIEEACGAGEEGEGGKTERVGGWVSEANRNVNVYRLIPTNISLYSAPPASSGFPYTVTTRNEKT